MKRILVIEPDVAISALVREWLTAAGYLAEARDLQDARSHIPPALIIASMVNLRGQGAIELDNLRADFPDLPIVGLSGQIGHSLSIASEAAMSLGVLGVLAKPFSRLELLDAVTKALFHAHEA